MKSQSVVLFFIISLCASCAHFQEYDRSSLNHPLMLWDSNTAPRPSSPLTGLEDVGSKGGAPCSVCAK